MLSKHFCPQCGANRFITVAHVTQDWIVDPEGNYEECEDQCVETVHGPDDGNTWCCNECGAEAEIVADLTRPSAAEQCAKYISMLTGKHYEDNILDVPAILENAESVFGKEMVALVVAATITRHPSDGRIDYRNRKWAAEKICPVSDISNAVKAAECWADVTVYGAHMGFVDLLATALRGGGEG